MKPKYVCRRCGFESDKDTACLRCSNPKLSRQYIPTEETEKVNFQKDDFGHYRIKIGKDESTWFPHEFIARLKIDDVEYIAFSNYYENEGLLIEKVYMLVEV